MLTKFNTGLPTIDGLSLQCCDNCHRINYPQRELCGHCLADSLRWQPVSGDGIVLSLSELHYPLEPNFSQHLPWLMGSIQLDVGPVAFAHLQPGLKCDDKVTLTIMQDQAGNRVLVATDRGPLCDKWLQSIQFKETSE